MPKFLSISEHIQSLLFEAHYILWCHPQQRAGWYETRLPQEKDVSGHISSSINARRNTHSHTQMWTSMNSTYTTLSYCHAHTDVMHARAHVVDTQSEMDSWHLPKYSCRHIHNLQITMIIYLLNSYTLHKADPGCSPSLWLSSVTVAPESEGWGGGPTRVKPSAPLGPGRSSEDEPEGAEAGLDLRAGIAVMERCNEMYS